MIKCQNNMTNGIIYKYTSPSGKVYIGQTINEKEEDIVSIIWIEDTLVQKLKGQEKYGPKNFKYEVIFKVSSHIQDEVREILNKRKKNIFNYLIH